MLQRAMVCKLDITEIQLLQPFLGLLPGNLIGDERAENRIENLIALIEYLRKGLFKRAEGFEGCSRHL